MKLAIITGNYYQDLLGGAEYQAWMIAKNFAEHGHEVKYIAISSVLPTSVKWIDGIELLRISAKDTSRNTLLEQKISDVNAIYLRRFSSLTVVQSIARPLGIPIIFSISSQMDCRPVVLSNGVPRIISHFKNFISIKSCDGIVCQTEKQKTMLERYFTIRDLRVIHNGQYLPPIDQIAKRTERKYITWVNNLKPFKRPQLFVKIAKELRDSNYPFIMIGSKPKNNLIYMQYIDRVLQNTPDNFQYKGFLKIDEVNRILSETFLYVNTSTQDEGFPNSYIQSWARGTPTISLEFDPDSVITANKLGRITKNIQNTVKVITDLDSNNGIWEEYSNNALSYVARNHDIHTTYSQFESYFNTVIQ